ncbi:MAG: nodulation protein NfeD [Proteobacteria bacterium]|nr:nodulation protein NfeD [Pseudomonadota bacterium]
MKKLNKITITALLYSLQIIFLIVPLVYGNTIDVIEINGPITPVIAEYFIKSIEEAEKNSAECLIVQLDTPGGLDLSMRDIIKKIFASRVPVIVYVSPSGARAASAGAIITLAAHIAAMAPSTNIGAAHPVNLGGGEMGKDMAEKVVNDAAAYVEGIALKRNRNKEWAIKAVRESVSLSEKEALKNRVIDVISPDLKALIAEIDGKGIETKAGTKKLETRNLEINFKKMGMRETILKTLCDPNIAYILFLIGLAGLYFEFSNPGVILPGVIGGISLILSFYSLQTLSANYAGVLLILLAVILFIAELKVASYGILSIGGIIALTLGSLMLFTSSVPYLRISWSVLIPSIIFFSLFFISIVGLTLTAYRRKPATGREGLINMTGTALTDIHQSGKVFVHGEYWNARSDSPIEKGAAVRILKMQNMELFVEKSTQ